ncbi:hypothetical protein [Rugosimonospora africana]|uniref:hypothetical protein n=1 Tax=Rugosimonospora africana TaxID=556532 RepID=UPI001EF25FD9|nr:hypothetical protein [Rugosimonospora africana]
MRKPEATGTTKETEMFTHPDLLLAQQKQHQRDLITQAAEYRLLAAARRSRRARRGASDAGITPVVRGRPAGNLAPCGPHAAASAR